MRAGNVPGRASVSGPLADRPKAKGPAASKGAKGFP
jgi:hypothetical protein